MSTIHEILAEFREAASSNRGMGDKFERLFAKDFWAFSKAGRELARWHLNYETVEPYHCLMPA